MNNNMMNGTAWFRCLVWLLLAGLVAVATVPVLSIASAGIEPGGVASDVVVDISAIENENNHVEQIGFLVWLLLVLSFGTAPVLPCLLAAARRRQRIGLEFEFIRSNAMRNNRSVEHYLTSATASQGGELVPVRAESYNHETVSHWKVIHDNSLTGGGAELVSPPLTWGQSAIVTVRRLLRHLAEQCWIDRSCGFHTHVEVRMKDTPTQTPYGLWGWLGRIALAHGYFRVAWDQMVSSSRRGRGAEWCADHHLEHQAKAAIYGLTGWESYQTTGKPVQLPDTWLTQFTDDWALLGDHERYINIRLYGPEGFAHLMAKADNRNHVQDFNAASQSCAVGWKDDVQYHLTNQGRYKAVNIQSWMRQGTVEYRQHQGTLNGDKVVNWVALCDLFTQKASELNFEYAINDPLPYRGGWVSHLFEWLHLGPQRSLRRYWMRRVVALRGSLGRSFTNGRTNEPFGIWPVCDECGDDGCDMDQHNALKHVDKNRLLEMHCLPQDLRGSERYYCHDCDCDRDECGHEYYGVSALFGLALLEPITAAIVAAVALVVGCGIGALHRVTDAQRAGEKGNINAQKLTRRLWLQMDARGKDATGLAYFTRKGEIRGFKSPAPAKALTSRLGNTYASGENGPACVWTHGRFATHGRNTSENAHPHVYPPKSSQHHQVSTDVLNSERIVLVHNGVISQHEDAFKALGLQAFTACDSEVIAAALWKGGLDSVVKHLTGAMALIWGRTGEPDVLNLWRNDGNPLHMARLIHAGGPIVAASTKEMLQGAVANNGQIFSQWECKAGRHYRIEADGSITSKDIEGWTKTNPVWKFMNNRTWDAFDDHWIDDFESPKAKPTKAAKMDTSRPVRDPKGERKEHDIYLSVGGDYYAVRADKSVYCLPDWSDPRIGYITWPELVEMVEAGELDPQKASAIV